MAGRPLRRAREMLAVRHNGTRAGLIRHLTTKCGLTPEEAERLAPKKDMPSPRRALSPQQLAEYERTVKRLITYPGVRTALLLLPKTGLRIAEVCALDVRTFTAGGRRNNLSADVIGKGQKLRRVPFGSRGTALVHAYLRTRPRAETNRLLLGPRGGPLTPATVRAACTRVAAAMGLAGKLTPHVLRHSFASQALLHCQDMHSLQARLGHGKVGSKRLPAVTLTYLDV